MRTLPPAHRALRHLFLAAALLVGLLFSPRAHAGGTVSIPNREPAEVDGKWKLNFTIDYGSIPLLPHIPMLFVFTHITQYDLSLTDKSPEKPVLTRIPLQNQQPINESMDVGFSDASGKVFKITKFDFVIRRDHGFEAGEYELKIKREDDGVQIGQTFRLTLKGDNPVVDRRAIVFAGEKAKKKDEKKDDEKKDGDAKKDDEKKDDAPAADAADAPKDPAGDNAPPPVPPKQGGCGCRVAGETGPDGAAAALALALGAAVIARRRGRRGAAESLSR